MKPRAQLLRMHPLCGVHLMPEHLLWFKFTPSGVDVNLNFDTMLCCPIKRAFTYISMSIRTKKALYGFWKTFQGEWIFIACADLLDVFHGNLRAFDSEKLLGSPSEIGAERVEREVRAHSALYNKKPFVLMCFAFWRKREKWLFLPGCEWSKAHSIIHDKWTLGGGISCLSALEIIVPLILDKRSRVNAPPHLKQQQSMVCNLEKQRPTV